MIQDVFICPLILIDHLDLAVHKLMVCWYVERWTTSWCQLLHHGALNYATDPVTKNPLLHSRARIRWLSWLPRLRTSSCPLNTQNTPWSSLRCFLGKSFWWSLWMFFIAFFQVSDTIGGLFFIHICCIHPRNLQQDPLNGPPKLSS